MQSKDEACSLMASRPITSASIVTNFESPLLFLEMSTRPPTLNIAASLQLPRCVAAASSEGSYILALASTSSAYAALATSSAESAQGNGILLYALTPGGFARIQGFPIGAGSIPSAMRVVNDFCGRSTLLSSHQKPGCIKVWDERGGPQPVSESQSID